MAVFIRLKNEEELTWKGGKLPILPSQSDKINLVAIVGQFDAKYATDDNGHLVDPTVIRKWCEDMEKGFGAVAYCPHDFVKMSQDVLVAYPEPQYLDLDFYICKSCGKIKDISLG